MKPTFLQYEKPLLTTMVQADCPARIKELIDLSLPEGAEAFGMQFEKMKAEYRTPETYRDLFAYANGLPIYVTNYRNGANKDKSDEVLADELVELAACGATLCDVMADYYDPHPLEYATSAEAVKKQIELVDRIHAQGAEVLMSSHVKQFISAEYAVEIALAHQARGADISKIVVKADTMEQQLENMRIITLLKEKLQIPFLFLCGGECHLLRRVNGLLGCCMYLCVHEHDSFATPTQPLLRNLKAIRDNM